MDQLITYVGLDVHRDTIAVARAALAMPAPQATAAPEEITATVSADYVLVP